MSRLLWVSCCAVFVAFGFWCGPAEAAEIIAEQNFDAIPQGSTSHTSTGGTDLGFQSIGVADGSADGFVGTVGVDASGRFQIQNVNGNAHDPDDKPSVSIPPAVQSGVHGVQFDTVDLSGFRNVTFEMNWDALGGGWEGGTGSDGDMVLVRLLLDDGNSLSSVTLIDSTGVDLDSGFNGAPEETAPNSSLGPGSAPFQIPNGTVGATLQFFGDNSAGGSSELLVFDNIVFQGEVPEPASVAIWTLLGAVAGLFVWRRRRRNRS